MNKTVSQQKRVRRIEPREVRRRQLIDATIASIARFGIGGTTMSTVTEIAGLSIGIVNFHFKSKQNLLEETLLHLAREHHEHWRAAQRRPGLSPREKLTAIVESHFNPPTCSSDKIAVWFAFYGEVGRRAVYRALLDEFDNERMAVSTELCAELGATGQADLIAGTLEGLFDGMWLSLLMYPDTFAPEDARAHIYGYLAGVFPAHFEPICREAAT